MISETKARRVASYVGNIVKEVGIIAHSCGVKNLRALTRSHARIVMGSGDAKGMNELYPESGLINEYAHSD